MHFKLPVIYNDLYCDKVFLFDYLYGLFHMGDQGVVKTGVWAVVLPPNSHSEEGDAAIQGCTYTTAKIKSPVTFGKQYCGQMIYSSERGCATTTVYLCAMCAVAVVWPFQGKTGGDTSPPQVNSPLKKSFTIDCFSEGQQGLPPSWTRPKAG